MPLAIFSRGLTIRLAHAVLYILLHALPARPQTLASSRLVITFTNRSANLLANADLYPNATLVKRYGRRLVLDLRRPFELGEEEVVVRRTMLAVERVEVDFLINAGEFEDAINSTDMFDFTSANFSSDVAYEDIPGVVFPQDFAGQVPPLSQWNLMDSEPYSIRAEGVWKVTNSTPSVVVAVIDTGLAEPAREYFLNVVDGYDFISDADLALDWDGRDPDATDPGDWGDTCPTPSWHGTRVASILAARHDNKFGMRGVAQNCSVMPVRVLGLCKMGYANDVTDAIVWAAGGTIDGVPANPLPAKVLSLSLAGQGECPSYMQSAIDLAVSMGSVVIAAAGNNNKDVSGFFPANCRGVIAVAASTRQGTLAGYSNHGKLVSVSAPGGDYANPIMTLKLDSLETDLLVAFGTGTSFAVPHVAGVSALMIYNNALNLSNMKSILMLPGYNTSSTVIELKKFSKVFASESCVTDSKYSVCDVNFEIFWDVSQCTCTCAAGSYHEVAREDTIYGPLYYEACFACPACEAGKYKHKCGCEFDAQCRQENAWVEPYIRCGLCALQCKTCPYPSFSSAGSSACTTCKICGPGSYMSKDCTNIADRSCQSCPSHTYSSSNNQAICSNCSSCAAGEYRKTPCSSSVDTDCEPCLAGTSFTTDADQASCQACTDCNAGSRVSADCTRSSDRVCAPCTALVSFTTTKNQSPCSSCTRCEAGKYKKTDCKRDADTVCETCIAKSTYTTAQNQASCSVCSDCTEGSKMTADCSINSDRVCEACVDGTSFTLLKNQATCTLCSTCNAGFFRFSVCTIYSDTVCNACTVDRACPAGQSVTACTAQADSRCSTCSPDKPSNSAWTSGCTWQCSSSYYRTGSTCTVCSTYAAAPTLSTQISCATDKYFVACTTTENSKCVACTNKPAANSQYSESSGERTNDCSWICNAGYTKNSGSTACELCPAGKYSTTAGGSCITCSACTTGEYNSGCSGSSAGTCTSCSCTAGQYASGCAGSSRGTCSTCTARVCAAGTTLTACSAQADSECTACSNKPVDSQWSSGCDWICNAGYIKNSGNTACQECQAGKYSTTAGGTCLDCPPCTAGLYNNGCGRSSSGGGSGGCSGCTNT